MANVLYKEVQHLRQNLLWLIALTIPAVVIFGTLSIQLFTGKPMGDKPMSNLSLIILGIFYLVPMVFLFTSVKMETIIDEKKIAYGWNIPSKELNDILFSDIKELSVIEYKFVGYGYEITKRYGTVYNVMGNKGLQIIKKSGEKFLIGTRKADELAEVIKKINLG
jgi:hypothetical protein